jgi:uncharacterized protein YndB with AHSA1/START domain
MTADRRLVTVETEVPGTPEEVWEAIATGPGISCWFVPAEVEGREGGRIVTDHGPYGSSEGTVTAWEPPHRFAYEERDWAEGAPPWATEVLVEARSGGTCVVRLISGLFSDASGWEDDIDATEHGWAIAIETLRVYLTHFAGQPCSHVFAVGDSPEPADRVWDELRGALGLDGTAVGATVDLGAPRLRGVVERMPPYVIVLRVEEPAPGIAEVYAHPGQEKAYIGARLYLYGDDAAAVAEREEPAWQAWLDRTLAAA